jgi:hypothetical protein
MGEQRGADEDLARAASLGAEGAGRPDVNEMAGQSRTSRSPQPAGTDAPEAAPEYLHIDGDGDVGYAADGLDGREGGRDVEPLYADPVSGE